MLELMAEGGGNVASDNYVDAVEFAAQPVHMEMKQAVQQTANKVIDVIPVTNKTEQTGIAVQPVQFGHSAAQLTSTDNGCGIMHNRNRTIYNADYKDENNESPGVLMTGDRGTGASEGNLRVSLIYRSDYYTGALIAGKRYTEEEASKSELNESGTKHGGTSSAVSANDASPKLL